MDHRGHPWRVGITAMACALLLGRMGGELPRKALSLLAEPDTAAFFFYLETGRDVRFSASEGTFSPDFMESAPPALPKPEKTVLPSFSDPEQVALYYAVSKEPDIEELLRRPLVWQLAGEEPTVLILHTHTTESYTKQGETYRESARWRTREEEYNMLSIGALVAEELAKEGIVALQDRQLHDYPSYNGSYAHARKSLEGYLEEYPGIRLVLDLHRDASGESGRQMRTCAAVEGQTAAQLMIVLGTGHDGYEENLSLGLKLHAQLEEIYPGIMRPLQLRSGRFNQDLCPGALLVEVGAAGNSHAEARLAAKALAEAIALLAAGTQ